MSKQPFEIADDTPVYVISIAAQIAGLHAQTLRQYDRLGLVSPERTPGGGRLYSTRDIDQLREVIDVGLADAVLLDNMDAATLHRAVAMVAGKFPLEASGGITLDSIAEIAKTGVDYASSGWITHSAPNLDVALDIEM